MHPRGSWANRNPVGRIFRLGLSIQCDSHTYPCVSLPTASAHLPGRCTSISPYLASFCIECHRQTDTYWIIRLLFQLLLALREVLLFGGNGLSAAPKLEPAARQQGLKAPLHSWEHFPLPQELVFCRRVRLTNRSRVTPASLSTGSFGKFCQEMLVRV